MKFNQDALFKFNGLWWAVEQVIPNAHLELNNIEGPFCPDCYYDMSLNQNDAFIKVITSNGVQYKRVESWEGEFNCLNCNKRVKTKLTFQEYKTQFLRKYISEKRSRIPKFSLDEPPTHVKVRDQDEKYFLAAKIGQKDGKRVGVVYLGEKNKDQDKRDYSQIFIDLDDEQLRFDKSNKHPKEVVAKIKIDFKESSTEIKAR